MTLDFEAALKAATRTVLIEKRDDKRIGTVKLERDCDTSADALWDTLTNPEQLRSWFLPVSGELKLGGRYQFEGNAGGTVTECTAPQFFAATWEFAGGVSWIEVRIAPVGAEKSRLALSHICPIDDHWEKFGSGAAGVGWDLALIGLAAHVVGADAPFDEEALTDSPEGRAFIASLSKSWREASVAAGEAPEHAVIAEERTTAFYTGEEYQEG